jgi:hypothetical protein
MSFDCNIYIYKLWIRLSVFQIIFNVIDENSFSGLHIFMKWTDVRMDIVTHHNNNHNTV